MLKIRDCPGDSGTVGAYVPASLNEEMFFFCLCCLVNFFCLLCVTKGVSSRRKAARGHVRLYTAKCTKFLNVWGVVPYTVVNVLCRSYI